MKLNKKIATKVGKEITIDGMDYYGYVKLYDVFIVAWNNTHIRLDCEMWRTATTRRRMNQVSDEYDFGFRVFQSLHQWWAFYKDANYPFDDDGIVILERK